MSHLTASYVDFVQLIGVVILFGIIVCALKNMLFNIEKVLIKVVQNDFLPLLQLQCDEFV